MARSEARVGVDVWDQGSEFTALTSDEQWMHLFLASQRDLTHAGVIALRERRWARSAAGLTPEDVTKRLEGLQAAGYVLIDYDTEELLIRRFVYDDRVYRQPNVLRKAQEQLDAIASPVIREALAQELERIRRLEMPEGSRPIVAEMLVALGRGSSEPSRAQLGSSDAASLNPSDCVDLHARNCSAEPANAAGDPSGKGSQKGLDTAAEGLRDPSSNPHGGGGRVRRGSNTSPIPESPPPPSPPVAALGPTREGEGAAATDEATALVLAVPWPAGKAPVASARTRLVRHVAACLTRGHPPDVVRAELTQNLGSARDPVGAVISRLKDLAAADPALTRAPATSQRPPARPPWCGECDQQTRMRTPEDERPHRCPECHPLTTNGGAHA